MKKFFNDSKSTGIVLLCCTVVSVLLANGVQNSPYLTLWTTHFTEISIVPHSLLHVINEGLMSVFFFFAAIEIKREVISGELNSVKKALMPLMSAVGGMLVPAFIYLVLCGDKSNNIGWGIPMATDIAFSLAILSLLGKLVPVALRIFLTAVAVIDDIGGIITIAVFYPGNMNMSYLLMGMGTLAVPILLSYKKVSNVLFYIPFGLLLWFFIYNSGVSTSLAGVLMAFVMPSSLSHKLLERLHIPVNFIILPLFAMANTAIVFPDNITQVFTSPVYMGIFAALSVGKPLGIFLFANVAAALKIATLPKGISQIQLLSVGIICGIGFTVSLFITSLAFADAGNIMAARLAIISASLLSGVVGYFLLKLATNTAKK